jgi:cellulose biosynthesis protein BcsQ
LADNVFNVADRLLTPLVPTTLSFEAHRQLLAFASEDGHKERLILGFLSMVDRRKKLHRELAEAAAAQFPGILTAAIPYTAQVERMGVAREPVPAFAPRSEAAKAYQNLWVEVATHLWPGRAAR